MAETLLTLSDISVRYGESAVVQMSRLDVYPGEVLAVIGPNGAGKSTLLRVMGLLQKPTTGKVYFAGEEVNGSNALTLRRRTASVFQHALLLNASVHDNAALGLKLRGLDRADIESRLRPWLERLGIIHLASRPARSLSGGEAQRTSLARALAVDPELLLLDEPFSALDPATRETLLLDLKDILSETGVTTVLVTHDRHEAFMIGRRVGVLQRGKLLQLGMNLDVFMHPVNEAVAEVVGVDTKIPAVVETIADGVAIVRFNGGKAKVVSDFEPGSRVILCIRPEEIRLSRPDREPPINGLNRIQAKVTDISPWLSHYRVKLECADFALVALVSRASLSDLSLRNEQEAIASFSPEAVHVIRSVD